MMDTIQIGAFAEGRAQGFDEGVEAAATVLDLLAEQDRTHDHPTAQTMSRVWEEIAERIRALKEAA